MMTARSDIEHWQINATVYKDRVEEVHYITDPARNIRRRPQTKVWNIERFLGRGSFGEVRLQRSTEDGKARAVKRIPTASANLSIQECERELKALLEFSKPKSKEAAVFVDFLGWFKDGSDVFLAMEYIPLGDLETNVVAQSGKVPEVEARDITEQILFGLEIMHAESFAHRDLKPQNVLVVHGPPQWWVKLADFGLSKRLTESTAYHTKSGTQSYMAPEILEYNVTDIPGTEYTNAVDMWAVGCITYRLVTSIVPFPPGRSLWRYCEDQSLFPYGPCFDSGIKGSCFGFIKGLLEIHPKKRPSASQALAHTWVSFGSNAGRQSVDRPRPSQETPRVSESIVSNIDYNTVSHDGLKSYRLPSPSHTDSSETPPASNSNSSVRGSIVKQLSTEEGATLPELKLDKASSDSAATERAKPSGSTYAYSNVGEKTSLWPRGQPPSPAAAFPQPTLPQASMGSSTDAKTVVLPPDSKVLTSAPREKTAKTMSGRILQMFKTQKTDPQRSSHTSQTLKDYKGVVDSVAFSPNCTLMASGSMYDSTVRIWDIATGNIIQTLKGHEGYVRSVSFSPSGNVIGSASEDSTVRLWDVASGSALQRLKGNDKTVKCMAFSPNSNMVVSGSTDYTVWLWDTATGAILRKIKGHTHFVNCVTFSPNGNVVASGSSDGTVRLWDTATGAQLQMILHRSTHFSSVAFSPDGNVVASGSWDNTVLLSDTTTGALLHKLKGHKDDVDSVAFFQNGSVVASGSSDRTIRLWNVATGAHLETLKGHLGMVVSVASSPDGNMLLSGSSDNTICLWDVSKTTRTPLSETLARVL